MRKACAALLALSALASGTSAEAAQRNALPCVQRDDAASLVQLVAPDLIQAAGVKCAAALPRTALLRNQSSTMISRYRRAAVDAWPGAQRALAGVAGADLSSMLGGELGRSLIGPMVAPLFLQNVQSADCENLNTIVTMIEPLPAANLGKLFVAIYDMAERGGATDSRAQGGIELPLHLCDNQQG